MARARRRGRAGHEPGARPATRPRSSRCASWPRSAAGGGDLEELREQLVALRLTESPQGIEEAEEAALELERAIGAPPRLAEPAYLDRVGAAARRLEQALGRATGSPFAEAMKQGMAAVDELVRDVETNYRATLD